MAIRYHSLFRVPHPQHRYKKQPQPTAHLQTSVSFVASRLAVFYSVDIDTAISYTAHHYVSSPPLKERRPCPNVLHWLAKHQSTAEAPGEGRSTRRDFLR
jgi:hypothetical protein